MIWAKVGKEKIEALPKTMGTCPLCNGKVFSKCGEINVWHWAHFNGDNCDSWYEPETFWHKHWKMTFGKENAEVVRKKDGKWHIADILTKEGVVIELQNSPIQKHVIREREEFYGERMFWLINGNHFKQNFQILDWRKGNYKGWLLDSLRESKSKKNKNKNKKSFRWKYARRSWADVQRNVFIDFGEETLFWIKEGMGSSKGFGVFINKEKFIEKYGGDYEYYYQQTLSNIINENK